MPLEFLIENGWKIFIGVFLLIVLLVIYFVREKLENSRIQSMQSDQISMEMRTNEKNEVTQKFQPKNKKSKSISKKILFSTGTLGGMKWTNKKTMEVILTETLISQLRSVHTGGFFVRKIIARFIPGASLDELMKKALAGELKPGMKVRIENGQMTIEEH